MNYKHYQAKINDVIVKCPLEIGVEILVYNLLDEQLKQWQNLTLVDINTLRKNRDERLTTDAGISDIAILSSDFVYQNPSLGTVYGFVEVKATNQRLNQTNQLSGQLAKVNHLIYTNGLVWTYYYNHAKQWEICLTTDGVEVISSAKLVEIDEEKFKNLITELNGIKWLDDSIQSVDSVKIQPIGTIKQGYKDRQSSPKQGYYNKSKVFELWLEKEYLPAMQELKIGDKIQVLYFGNQADRTCLRSTPPHQGAVETGVFSTRSPNRPNPIAICIADIIDIKENVIYARGLDALDGSQIVDIKGYSKHYHEKLMQEGEVKTSSCLKQ